ncbi:hypothetical protein CDAR_127651 [Caerostris darwini]|uniref:Uncharacterized protein n=1 Tax=Caerostris darwini TaxID=1538125 RepID=A0AAV4QDN6_9ARAC|nr:hypothetical protein CDAR_127651 [Caerostris darwini]
MHTQQPSKVPVIPHPAPERLRIRRTGPFCRGKLCQRGAKGSTLINARFVPSNGERPKYASPLATFPGAGVRVQAPMIAVTDNPKSSGNFGSGRPSERAPRFVGNARSEQNGNPQGKMSGVG